MTYHEKVARLMQLTGAADATLDVILAKLRKAFPSEAELRARISESEAMMVAIAMMIDRKTIAEAGDELRRWTSPAVIKLLQ
jgi:hypothetical protein